MANSSGLCTSFKTELLTAKHNFGTAPTRAVTTPDVFKAALYSTTANITAATTSYTSTGEVTGTGYTAGGVTITSWSNPASNSGISYTTPTANIVFSNITIGSQFDCVLIYNSSQGNAAVSVHTFTPQTIVSGTLTLTVPANTSTTGLIRLA